MWHCFKLDVILTADLKFPSQCQYLESIMIVAPIGWRFLFTLNHFLIVYSFLLFVQIQRQVASIVTASLG